MSIERLVREVFGSALSSALDPNPIHFKQADEFGVRPVRTGCEKPTGRIYRFTKPINRNAFLCGCMDYTEHEAIEHLIVGLGAKYGSTTKVAEMSHVCGESGYVSIPSAMQQAIKSHVESDYKHEVLVFHNHPRNVLNVTFDNTPLPSGTDRDILFGYLTQPLVGIKALLGGGRVRCYLGENGFVQEFRTPELLSLLERSQKRQQSR